MTACGWFWAMDRTGRATFLSRFSWLAAVACTLIGLLPTGWELVKYVADNNSVTARYGLWKIEYLGTVSFTSTYVDWAAAQPEGSTAYARVQAVRACVVLGLAGLAFQLLASLRLWCAKDMRVRRRYMVACCSATALDFAFTVVALLLWKTIPREAFLTFCSVAGCILMPDAPDAVHMTLYFSWGFFIVKALLSFPGLVSLVYLCTGFPFDGDAEAEERQQKSAQAGSAGKALKKSISSKKSSSSISPKNNGAGKNKSPKQGATGSGKATGSGSRNKKWHEEEGEEEGQDGDEETGHAAQVVEEEGEAEEEDPFPPKKKGGGASPKSTSPKGGASPSNKKGGFDRHAPVTYASATGNANPSWLN